MRNILIVPAIFGALLVVTGCASMPEAQVRNTTETDAAKQTVKIYDVAPPNASPIGLITATACDGTREAATDALMLQSMQRNGNGITQISCQNGGMTMACWSTTICTATALAVTEPPPRPVAPAPPQPTPKKKAKRAAAPPVGFAPPKAQ